MTSLLGVLAHEVAGAFRAWGELVRYHPGGDVTAFVERTVIIDREPRPSPRREDGRASTWACTVWLRRDATLGRLAVSTSDKMTLPLGPDGTPELVRVARIAAVDHGIWQLECLR